MMKKQLPLKILVAEDERVMALHICGQLKQYGHKTHLAHNGNEALQALSNEFFDLVLMDIEMPEMNGLEATRKIRCSKDEFATIPIIGVSSNQVLPAAEQCRQAGMNNFISKPFSIHRFEEALWQAKSRDTLMGGQPTR